MLLDIVQVGHKALRKKCKPVTVFDEHLMKLSMLMHLTMLDAKGIGLAAPQIDEDIAICVVDVRPTERMFNWLYDGIQPPLGLIMPLTLVNPVISKVSETQSTLEEGCLSIKDVRCMVKRPTDIMVEFQDVKGDHHVLACTGLFARCVQHEIDHLNGILITDY